MKGDECWACGTERNVSEHHIQARRWGGDNEPSNLLPLCRPCHDVVEVAKHFTVADLERMDKFPRLQTVLIARVMADVYESRAMLHIEDEVLRTAISVLENPHDKKELERLRGASFAIKKMRKFRHERSTYVEWLSKREAEPENPLLKGGL